MYCTLFQFGIPPYIVSLRHECSHKSIPPLGALKCAINTSLRWLQDYYWEPQRQLNRLRGQLYIDQLPKERAKRVGQCILSASKWVTPLEFERLGGKSAKKWKLSLSHNGRPLSDYNLVCSTAETSITSHVAMQAGSTMIIDVVLALIKAFRLRGDKTSLSSIVLYRFDKSAVECSKRLLWESCKG